MNALTHARRSEQSTHRSILHAVQRVLGLLFRPSRDLSAVPLVYGDQWESTHLTLICKEQHYPWSNMPMIARIAINGFGRIGRLALRAILARYPDDFEVVAIIDIADTETTAYLFKYDTNYGPFPGQVDVSGDTITIDDHPIRVFSQSEPANVPWDEVAADSDDPPLSTDLKGNSHSSIFSAADTMALDDMVTVVSWYDNEWGYACRVADLAHFMTARAPTLAGAFH